MLNVRDATLTDLDQIMKIYKYAQDYMIRSGNPSQWGYSYPEKDLIRSDIRQNICKLICNENEIHGVFALWKGAEPTYAQIQDGGWLNDEPYVTIHRIAGDGQVRGLFNCAVNYCKSISQNIRIDTHADNLTMQKAIEKEGFVRCGIVHVRDGSERIAYQWSAQ